MIPLHKVLIADDALEKVGRTLHSGLITEGPRVKEFEAALEQYLGVRVLAVNSCTSAIDLALHLCSVGPGDQVISTPLTCAATNTHVLLRGAQLVWADVDPRTGNISVDSAFARITPRTKAVIAVDWGGRPVEWLGAIRARGVPVIQDSAHSFGAHFARSHDYQAWSFQAIKHLTCGDGGALKVPGDQYDRARALRWFGIDRETKAQFRFLQDIPEAGYKYHMNDLSAALGLANLPAACASVEQHRHNASRLHELLVPCSKIKAPPPSIYSSWWFYSLRMPNWEAFVAFAETRGVQAGPVHGRNDAYSSYDKSHYPLPGVDEYASQHVAIPCGWWVGEPELKIIADTVLEWDARL